MAKRVVVIGGVAAGCKAAARAKRVEPGAEVILLERGEQISYGACGLPYAIGGVAGLEDLVRTPVGVKRDEAFFLKVKGVEVRTRSEVVGIDRERKAVRVRVPQGAEYDLPYDSLILATGSLPVVPPLPGVELPEVFRLKDLDDGQRIREFLDGHGGRRAVIVGGGMIGVEMAEALSALGAQVTVVEMMAQVLPGPFDPEMALLVQRCLERHGVRVLTGHRVTGFERRNGSLCVRTEGAELVADMALLAIGVRPNVELAHRAGLRIGSTRAIWTDAYLRTSDPCIYACGDCAETVHLVSGQRTFIPLGSTANRQGRVAGTNAVGGAERFAGVLGTTALKVFEVSAGRTGLSEGEAQRLGLEVESVLIAAHDRIHYMPGASQVVMKLMVERASRRLLGLQAVGEGEVVKRVDAFAALLRRGSTLEDLMDLDLAYAPPFSTPLDPLNAAAHALANRQERRADFLRPQEAKELLEAGRGAILDVRTPGEFQEGHIPGSLHIPLGALREHPLEGLPRDRTLICTCKGGLRGYEAALILRSRGLQRVAVLEGGIGAWPFELER